MGEIILSDFFTTKPQANDFSVRLNTISGKIYETDFNLEKILREQFGSQKKDKFISLLRENEISIESNSALSKFIDQIQQTISLLPSANLVLAIEPSEKILKAISDWFLLNLKKQVVIEIEINPDLIAGVAVSYMGKHLDSSIKSEFEKVASNTLGKSN